MSMIVDVQACTVTWTHNGAGVKAQEKFKQLQDTSIRWVSYIYLSFGASVRLLEETWS